MMTKVNTRAHRREVLTFGSAAVLTTISARIGLASTRPPASDDGFKDVPLALEQAGFDPQSLSYFLTRRVLLASSETGTPVWQDRLYIALASTAADASRYFRIPVDRAVEIGSQLRI